jgi:hypothetical protein
MIDFCRLVAISDPEYREAELLTMPQISDIVGHKLNAMHKKDLKVLYDKALKSKIMTATFPTGMGMQYAVDEAKYE